MSSAPITEASKYANNVREPSEVVQPRTVNTVSQQGSTSPGDGGEVHEDGHLHRNKETNAELEHDKVSFKEQVIGVAQVARGTLLGKPDLKEHGEQILHGDINHEAGRNN